MSVIPITVFLSLGLVFLFVALFLREHSRRHFANAERDSLLPLADEQPRVQPSASATEIFRELAPDHGAGCGCQRGVRPPCSNCVKEAAGTPLR